MKSYLIILSLFLLSSEAFSQETDWQKATTWTLYDIKGKSIWKMSLDSLPMFPHKSLNGDSMQFFLAKTVTIPLQKAPVWMGAYPATCMLDHKKRKIDISTYGGFFYDELGKQFYQIPLSVQKDWLNYLSDFASFVQSGN